MQPDVHEATHLYETNLGTTNMELLLSILMWLGLISNGNAYTAGQIQQLEAQHSAAIQARRAELMQDPSTAILAPSKIDVSIVGP